MEQWSYRRNGGVEGPVSKDQLEALYQAGEITSQTLVRSSSAGGGWRRYGEVVDLRPLDAPPLVPRAVKRLWPLFVFGTPLLGGFLDVVLMRSVGNGFVEANAAWLRHVPIGVNLLAIALWLILIWLEINKRGQKNRIAGMIVWLVAAPIYQAFSWWAMALVSGAINVSLGYGLPECQADIAKAQVKELFERTAAKSGGAGAVALTDIRPLWGTDRIRMCAGKFSAANAKTYSVRYKIEDRGNNLFRNTLHGLNITMVVE